MDSGARSISFNAILSIRSAAGFPNCEPWRPSHSDRHPRPGHDRVPGRPHRPPGGVRHRGRRLSRGAAVRKAHQGREQELLLRRRSKPPGSLHEDIRGADHDANLGFEVDINHFMMMIYIFIGSRSRATTAPPSRSLKSPGAASETFSTNT